MTHAQWKTIVVVAGVSTIGLGMAIARDDNVAPPRFPLVPVVRGMGRITQSRGLGPNGDMFPVLGTDEKTLVLAKMHVAIPPRNPPDSKAAIEMLLDRRVRLLTSRFANAKHAYQIGRLLSAEPYLDASRRLLDAQLETAKSARDRVGALEAAESRIQFILKREQAAFDLGAMSQFSIDEIRVDLAEVEAQLALARSGFVPDSGRSHQPARPAETVLALSRRREAMARSRLDALLKEYNEATNQSASFYIFASRQLMQFQIEDALSDAERVKAIEEHVARTRRMFERDRTGAHIFASTGFTPIILEAESTILIDAEFDLALARLRPSLPPMIPVSPRLPAGSREAREIARERLRLAKRVFEGPQQPGMPSMPRYFQYDQAEMWYRAAKHLAECELNAAETAAERVAALEKLLDGTKQVEALTAKTVCPPNVMPSDLIDAQIARIDVEYRLAKLGVVDPPR